MDDRFDASADPIGARPWRPAPARESASRLLWFAPGALLALFVIASLTILWLVRTRTEATRRTQLVDRAESTAASLRLRLNGNLDYLLLLAAERRAGATDAASFQDRASRYVADHPELINVTWVDATYTVRDVAPLAANRQILGLSLELPEPKRASHLAVERREPTYTRAFEAIQGRPSFEIWVPVFQGDLFLGLYAGVYSCERLVQELALARWPAEHTVGLVDASGRVLWESQATATTDDRLVARALLTPPESGVQLQLRGYGPAVFDRTLWVLEALCVAFTLAMAYAMWRLKREMAAKARGEESLRQAAERTAGLNRVANAFLTVPDEEMYGEVLAIVLDLLRSRFGVFGYLADNGDLIVPGMSRDGSSGREVSGSSTSFPASSWGESVWARALRERKSMSSDGPSHLPTGQLPFRHSVAVPVVFGGRSIGLIAVADKEGGYTEEDRLLLESVGRFIAPVLNARLRSDREERERNRAESALRERELLYRSVVDAMSEGLCLQGADGEILAVNSAAERLEGRPAEEMLHKTSEDPQWGAVYEDGSPFPGDQHPSMVTLRTGEPQSNVAMGIHRPDGTLVWLAVNSQPLIATGESRPYAVVTTFRDTTEERRLAEESRALHRELESRVETRTAELAEALKELESFSYSVSHDLRAPVRAIDGFTSLLGEECGGALSTEGVRLLESIRRNSRKMGRLIDDLLEFSRSSRAELRKAPIRMSRLAEVVLEELLPAAERGRTEVRVAALPDAFGDPALVRIVLQNLLSNALKYSAPRESRLIEVGANGSGASPEYFVRDNGVGFDPRYKDKLFGVFQRLHAATEFEGTGIGLALVRRIVARHGGQVGAEGTVDGGATFWFTLGPEGP